MKDQLKKHIDKNRLDFDQYQNDFNAIWGNIEKGLDQEKNTFSRVFKNSLKIAASILIIISLGMAYYLGKRSVEFNKEGIALHNISRELAETEAFYTNLIDDQMQYINMNKSQLNNEILESINQLDLDYDELKKDLAEHADSDEVIDAMINYYRLKLEMLEKISEEIKEKKIENEKINI